MTATNCVKIFIYFQVVSGVPQLEVIIIRCLVLLQVSWSYYTVSWSYYTVSLSYYMVSWSYNTVSWSYYTVFIYDTAEKMEYTNTKPNNYMRKVCSLLITL